MRVRIEAETLRGYITKIYDCSMYENSLSVDLIVKICLGDFYMQQTKYSRIVFWEVLK